MCIDVDVSASQFSFRLRRIANTDGKAWNFLPFFWFNISSKSISCSIVWTFCIVKMIFFSFLFLFFLFHIRQQPFDHSFPLTFSYLELDYTFGFIWTFVLSIFNQRFTCRFFSFAVFIRLWFDRPEVYRLSPNDWQQIVMHHVIQLNDCSAQTFSKETEYAFAMVSILSWPSFAFCVTIKFLEFNCNNKNCKRH